MKKFLTLAVCALLFAGWQASAQKKNLWHDIYDTWNTVVSPNLSDDGNTVTYEIKAQVGDGVLTVHDLLRNTKNEIERGSGARIFGSGKWMSYTLNPSYDETRKAKIDRVARDKMPKSYTMVMNIATMKADTIMDPQNFTTAEKAPVIAYRMKAPAAAGQPADSTRRMGRGMMNRNRPGADNATGMQAGQQPDSAAGTPQRPEPRKRPGDRLVAINVEKGDTILNIEYVTRFNMSKDASRFVYTVKEDSVLSLNVWDKGKVTRLLETKKAVIGQIVMDGENHTRFAYTLLPDSTESLQYELYDVDFATLKPHKVEFTNGSLTFSNLDPVRYTKNAGILTFSIASVPQKAPKDTIPADEKFVMDLWSYTDTIMQSQQAVQARNYTKNTFQSLYNIKEGYCRQLTDNYFQNISVSNNDDDAKYYILTDQSPYMLESNWTLPVSADIYLYSPKDDTRKLILSNVAGAQVRLSPSCKWAVYYDTDTQAWYSLDTDSGQKRNLTETTGVEFFNDRYDMPREPGAYGLGGWFAIPQGKNAKEYIVVYDKYDMWLMDPSGEKAPKLLTDGRAKSLSYRLMRIDQDAEYFNTTPSLLMSTFNYANKERGYYSLALNKRGEVTASKPKMLMEGKYRYGFRSKAKGADRVLWTRENYNECPDLHISKLDFSNPVKLSNSNPDMHDYKWGSVELFKWNDPYGKEVEGMLYLPEGYDKSKKYPVIVYFYEICSDDLYAFSRPVPSASIIIPSMFASNDYVVFIPDVHFRVGEPGPSSVDAVVSGSQALIDRGIADPDRIGIQGQSWGGYQVNYIVTQTDMFRCASSGAGVSDMVSAYSLTRGDSGSPRMLMYEDGQSRIGASLLEALDKYMLNSPIFHLENITTPLLIRHDDNDEAVPFSQGIEMFNGMRRLGKVVWMLNYHNGGHNMRHWQMRKDWSVRMHQFFDYYLKDAPMPRWMKEGISLRERGKDLKLDY